MNLTAQPAALHQIAEGSPEPLGVSLVPAGVNVAVHSATASHIAFCLFDETGDVEVARFLLPGRTGPVFHGTITGLAAGARYGLRAFGDHAPDRGLRFNAAKLLVDPYALSLDRPFQLHPDMFDATTPDAPDMRDSAHAVPKAVVVDALALPTSPVHAQTPWRDTVIYELHVKGFTQRLPGVPEAIRGTFAGLGHPAAISHLKSLGVSAVELLPCSAWLDERHLAPLGLTNYWGYNPIAYLAPDPRLAPGGWAEVRAATDALAAAGIETLLDVVFNHTGESDQYGPSVSMRGLDNPGYYRLQPDDPSAYVNDAGTGNILALDHGPALRLTMDTLRAWRRFGGMAGFRFDLASVLGRRPEGYDPDAPLLAAISQDPELRDLKLIAEPWDCGPGGYQLGRFPPQWGEWNDRYRDTVRSFWRGDQISLGTLAPRLAGSEDVFGGRRPSRSVNYVIAHDGMTLADLVTYGHKHNEANGEQNRDGTDDNRSWNHGVEGPTNDPAVIAKRRSDQKALLATLLLSRGTPMLAMGSELGQSQQGNNNAYAQDNPLSWLDWSKADAELIDVTRRLIALRAAHPALRADRFLDGKPLASGPYPDVAWRRADGETLRPDDWNDPRGETLVLALAEPAADEVDRVVVVIHRGAAVSDITLPEPRDGWSWTVLLDTANDAADGAVGETHQVQPRSVTVLGEAPAPGRKSRGVDVAALDRLAMAAGIETDWWTLDGAYQKASAETTTTLLGAMDLSAATTQQALESLGALAETHDRRPLPFALTAIRGKTTDIPLTFPVHGPPPSTWLWIENERGEQQRLRACAADGAVKVVAGRDGRDAGVLTLRISDLPAGRYRVWRDDTPDAVCRLTVAPQRGYLPAAQRLTGLTAQLYGLKRDGDQGIGDFTTLGDLAAGAAQLGAPIVGVNPMHALFFDRRDRASPYYPSDRRFLDPIYLDLHGVPGAVAPGDTQGLHALPGIDYPAVWALKSAALEASFKAAGGSPELDALIAAGGAALQRFAVFQAISESQPGRSWREWPSDLQSPDSMAVATFAVKQAHRVRYHQYLQWLCDQQLAAAAARAGAPGLCRDLAVGAAPDSAEHWTQPHLIARGVSLGAPPDPLGPQGQVWGLPPFNPHRLKADGFEAIHALYASNMKHAGALRIDHVLGLTRQFWIPDGADASAGAYVRFPLDDLLGQLLLESERTSCIVIGEDLGTTPPGLRETLHDRAVLSYRVLPFERHDGGFIPPAAYPELALACVATHDLPPLPDGGAASIFRSEGRWD